MISFIVIGRNISFTVEKCFSSIYHAVERNGILDFEVIYVDSNSSDNTLELLKQFTQVRKFLITGEYNAAVGRNVGAKESKGDSLFFLDGDMEVCPDFLSIIYDDTFQLKYKFVSGDLRNYFYNKNDVFLNEAPYFKMKLNVDRIDFTTGGFFVIERILWEDVNGMRTSFRRGQDLDLGLRLANKGEFLLRKKELMCLHHTISYFNTSRYFNMFKAGDFLYPGVLFRKNFFNIYTWKVLRKTQSSAFLLFILLVLSSIISYFFIFLYLFLVLIRSILKKDRQGKSVLFHLFSFILIDLTVYCGFFFFYPKERELKYISV